MTINLEETDKIISIILGGISIIGLIFKKWITPKIPKLWELFKYLFYIPSKVKNLEKLLERSSFDNIEGKIDSIHSTLYILRHKCAFLMNECKIPIWECDLSGKCIWANKYLLDLFGMDLENVLDFGWLNALHPDDIQTTNSKWLKSIEMGVPYKARYRVVNKKTGENIFCQTASFKISDENGVALSFLGVVEPISKEIYKSE